MIVTAKMPKASAIGVINKFLPYTCFLRPLSGASSHKGNSYSQFYDNSF